MNGRSKTSLAYRGLLIWIAALYAVMQWRYPFIFDDIGFTNLYRDKAGTDNLSLSALADYYSWIRSNDNGRLANLFAPFATVFTPTRQIFPLITGCLMAAIVALVQKISQFRCHCPVPLLSLAAAWALLLLLLPWRDFIFSADFALNYIWGAAITLFFIYSIVKNESGGWTVKSVACMLPLSVVAGAWHEGFVAPSAIGLLLWAAARRGKMSSRFYIMCGLYVIAALIFLYCPGTAGRFSAYIHSQWPDITDPYFIWEISPLIILVCSAISSLLTRERSTIWTDIFRDPFCWIGAGVIVAGYGIAIMLNATPRAYLWPGVMAITLAMSLLIPLLHACLSPLFRRAMAIILLVLCSLQSIATIYWTDRYRKEYDCILGQIIRQNGGTVFHDVMQPWDLPAYTLFIPPRTVWTSATNYLYIHQMADYQFVGVIPDTLKRAGLSEGIPLGGNLNARKVNGHIVAPYQWREDAPDNVVRPRYVELQLTDAAGGRHTEVVLATAFITLPHRHLDGRVATDTLMYYRLHPSLVSGISEISTVNPDRQ